VVVGDKKLFMGAGGVVGAVGVVMGGKKLFMSAGVVGGIVIDGVREF
jgi:hypothetical protein